MADTSIDIVLIQYDDIHNHLSKLNRISSLDGMIRVYATIVKINRFNPKTIFYDKNIINNILKENNLKEL